MKAGRLKLINFLVVVILVFITAGKGFGQNQDKFKALYMYNFTKFMKWPSAKESGDFIIGVVGGSSVIPELNALAKVKKVQGTRNLVVKEFASSADITPDCHILFLPREKSKELPIAAKQCYPNNILLVTEYKDFAKKASCVNFVLVDKYQKFELNPEHLKKAGIQVASKFLSLAIVVN